MGTGVGSERAFTGLRASADEGTTPGNVLQGPTGHEHDNRVSRQPIKHDRPASSVQRIGAGRMAGGQTAMAVADALDTPSFQESVEKNHPAYVYQCANTMIRIISLKTLVQKCSMQPSLPGTT